MGYQALLFCPDEKTARTVTQVLSELDFAVISCTEPFAAVKKLMAEHFDAVVVDCDNEQNATLLFKSARNTPGNQSALAVAVVEGQTGVAKAFRIGANLVLTKPINVDQAKGTLRVARGLLRKSEGAKPAPAAASVPVKSVAPLPAPPKPAPQQPLPTVAIARPAAPAAAPSARAATASIPAPKPVQQPRIVASVPVESTETDTEILDIDEEIVSPSNVLPSGKSEIEMATVEPEILTPAPSIGHASPAGFGSGAASAPAPAREPKAIVSIEDKHSTVISEPASPVAEVAASSSDSSADHTSAPASAFTFGGNVSNAKSAGGRGKKVLLAVVAVGLVAACGYQAWMQWGISSGTIDAPTRVAQPLVTHKAAAPASSAAPAAPSAVAPSSAAPVQSTTTSSAGQPTEIAKPSSDSDTEDTTNAEEAPAPPAKSSTKAGSAKPSVAAAAASKAPATKPDAQPLMIKSGVSKPAAAPTTTTDAPAPSMGAITAAGNGGPLPNLGGSNNAPTPVLQTLNVSQGVSRGLLVKKVQPIYPPSALRLRTEGVVQLSATIAKNGNISAVKVLSGDPQLARAAVDAVKQWKYKPYLLNGEPVEIQTQVTMDFKLPN
jgi:protein TonB